MLLRSMMLASVRPFYAAAGDPPAGGAGDDAAGGTGDAGGDTGAADGTGGDAGGDTGAAAAGGAEGDGNTAGAEGDAAGSGTAKPAAAAAPPAETWKDKEIRRKHAQLQEEKRRNAEILAENETLRAIAARTAPAAGDPPAGDPPAARRDQQTYGPDDVAREAQRVVAQQNFDQSANAADAAGRTRYKDGWDKATETLKTLGGFDVPTMVSILATDDPAQVLFTLGSKPDEYQRIMELPEARRQNELVKLGIPAKKPVARPSDAPAPVGGVDTRARGSVEELRDDLPDEDWYARRARQKAARFAAKQAAGRSQTS